MDEPLEKKRQKEIPPDIGRAVLVQADGFRCMAFRDSKGQWRNYFSGDLLPETVKVLDDSV
ncbi:MAG TPA: hypothetical protein VN761_13835 [Candidatus Polarisedimenticolia bacterium]|nr:hypothetical protein [Candidatus Polarisedimenticolia bacterium]